ncbi:MAG TPA: YceI family protein [Pyrinomonadaceae bacterium]|nr:YceI family protein [Pyrinomonadaceae bacterium]
MHCVLQVSEVVIKTASVDTNNERRDTHLRSADFFDAEKYPEMTFKSRRISRQGRGFLAVEDLMIKGVTKEVTMPFNRTGPIKDPLPTGVRRLMVGASLTIDRREFGITWSRLTDTNELFVGNEVVIDINVEAIVARPRQAGE